MCNVRGVSHISFLMGRFDYSPVVPGIRMLRAMWKELWTESKIIQKDAGNRETARADQGGHRVTAPALDFSNTHSRFHSKNSSYNSITSGFERSQLSKRVNCDLITAGDISVLFAISLYVSPCR